MLPPRNGGEPLQAANAVGMADRIIYLCNVVDFDKKVINDDFIEAPSGEATSEEKLEFNVSAHGTIPDSPSMIVYISATTGFPKECLTLCNLGLTSIFIFIIAVDSFLLYYY